jgi:hypothetical protein
MIKLFIGVFLLVFLSGCSFTNIEQVDTFCLWAEELRLTPEEESALSRSTKETLGKYVIVYETKCVQ